MCITVKGSVVGWFYFTFQRFFGGDSDIANFIFYFSNTTVIVGFLKFVGCTRFSLNLFLSISPSSVDQAI